jgi:hypothetical protein
MAGSARGADRNVAGRRPYPAILIHPSVLRRFIASWRESVSFNMALETLNLF